MSALKSKIKKIYLLSLKKYQQARYGSCVVLLYHRVTDIETDPQLLSVKPENFEKQLTFLSKKYTVLTVDEFQAHLTQKRRFPKRSILITFDDGYADNCLEALPILERLKTQALFYIATGTLNTQNEYWWDAVERIVLLSKTQPDSDFTLSGKKYSVKNLNTSSRYELYQLLLNDLRVQNSTVRENAITELATLFESKVPRETHRAMTYDELKKMNRSSSAVIGAHTHLHPSLAALTYEEQLKEISASKEKLEELTGKKITHFSYPFGTAKDYNNDTLAIVEKLGFELVAANFPYICHSHSNTFQFPRFLVRDWDMKTFEKEVNTFFN